MIKRTDVKQSSFYSLCPCEGDNLSVAKPGFPPRAPPFRARKLLQVVEMCSGTGGAMDAAVSDIKRCADLFLFSTTFYSQSLTPLKPQGNSAFPPSHPAQRRWPKTSRAATPISHNQTTNQAATLSHNITTFTPSDTTPKYPQYKPQASHKPPAAVQPGSWNSRPYRPRSTPYSAPYQ